MSILDIFRSEKRKVVDSSALSQNDKGWGVAQNDKNSGGVS